MLVLLSDEGPVWDTHTRRKGAVWQWVTPRAALRQHDWSAQGPGGCFSSCVIVSFSQSAWQAPNDGGNCVFLPPEDMPFHCFTNWHRPTHSPSFLSLFLTFCLFFSVSLRRCLLPFSPFKNPTTACHNSEHHPALLRTTASPSPPSFFYFFLVFCSFEMSQSQHVGTNKSFWFIHLSRAMALVIA